MSGLTSPKPMYWQLCRRATCGGARHPAATYRQVNDDLDVWSAFARCCRSRPPLCGRFVVGHPIPGLGAVDDSDVDVVLHPRRGGTYRGEIALLMRFGGAGLDVVRAGMTGKGAGAHLSMEATDLWQWCVGR